jgi:hypothetical protein
MALSAKDRKGITIIAAVGVAVLLILLASQTLKSPKREHGCLPTGWSSSTVILLDHSEGVPEQTAREIERRTIDFVMNKVGTNDHISLYAVSDQSARALIPLFEGCKPPSTGNALTESQKTIQLRFRRDFLEKLEKALKQHYADSATSPIAQAISDLSTSEDLKTPQSNLIVFSDMIENSPALDMYHCSPTANPRQLYRQANAGAVERPTFHNVNIQVNLIPRRGLSAAALQCRKVFWPWFLGDDAGSSSAVNSEYLPG